VAGWGCETVGLSGIGACASGDSSCVRALRGSSIVISEKVPKRILVSGWRGVIGIYHVPDTYSTAHKTNTEDGRECIVSGQGGLLMDTAIARGTTSTAKRSPPPRISSPPSLHCRLQCKMRKLQQHKLPR
jgi:hypothetical protein